MNEVRITEYQKANEKELLRLLLELQFTHFHETAPKELIALNQEINIGKSYQDYIHAIHDNKAWKIYVAIAPENKIIGFIIGSTEKDDNLVHPISGKIEDWFVEKDHRNQGTGLKLYEAIEKWFKDNHCHSIQSDTWAGNESSIKAHEKTGFFVSGISFSKKI